VASDVCPMFFQQGTGSTLEQSIKIPGFTDIDIQRFMVSLNFNSEEAALTAAFAGGPVALAYRKFDEQTKKEVHQEYLDSIAAYQVNGGYNIPGEFVVGRGK